MNRLFKLQFLGPFALFAATLCAELAARALQYAPSSELLWFINLRMFGIFQRSDATLSYFVPIEGFQFFGFALPMNSVTRARAAGGPPSMSDSARADETAGRLEHP